MTLSSTDIAQRTSPDVSYEHYFDPDSFIADFENLQCDNETTNEAIVSASKRIARNLAALFTEHPTMTPQRRAHMSLIDERFGHQVTRSIALFLDDILAHARPLLQGLACGSTSYLCEVNPESGPLYLKRNNEFLADTHSLALFLAQADNDPTNEGKNLKTIAEETHARATTTAGIQSQGNPVENLHLKPHEVLLKLKPTKTEDDKHNETEWRRSLVDVLAHIQHMLDVQNNADWAIPPSIALGMPQTADNYEMRAYVDQHLLPENIAQFLRISVFDRRLRAAFKKQLPQTKTLRNKPGKSAEDIVDFMISQHLADELEVLLAAHVPTDPALLREHTDALCDAFSEYVVHFFTLLGQDIGRGIGRKLSPIDSESYDVTMYDLRFTEETPLHHRLTPFLDIAGELTKMVKQVSIFRRLFEKNHPATATNTQALFPSRQELRPPHDDTFFEPTDGDTTLADDSALQRPTRLIHTLGMPTIKLSQNEQTKPTNPTRIEDIVF